MILSGCFHVESELAQAAPEAVPMIQRPQFKAHFHVEIVKDEGVFLVSEIGHSVLSGRLFETLASLINGRRSSDEIVEALQAHASPAEVYYALMLLEQKGFLSEADQTCPAGEAAFWAIHGIAPQTARRRLGETKVAVTTFGEVAVEPFLALLESLHVQVGEAGTLGVVLTDDYLRKELQTYNREALRSGRPWILTKPVGSQLLIGPVFDPGRTGCWECLAQRLRTNRAVETFVQRKQHRDEPFPIPSGATPATQQVAYSIAATEIARYIARSETPQSKGELLSLDVSSWQTAVHTLTRQPHCGVCGDRASLLEQLFRPIELESGKKTFTEDGGHRVVAPEETLRKFERHISPITGAVRGLQRVTVNDGVIHVYRAGHNVAAQHYNLKHLQTHLRSASSGKGITDLQARASGLCEALERYSGFFQGGETRRKARFKDLDGLGIHPNDCMRFSARQYREREAINAKKSRCNYVPLPFEEEAEIEWTPVWSLTHKVHRYLPTQYCYYSHPSLENQAYSVGCSNGNAAGNTIEEAILQGFLELVERDSVALWWYNRARRPRVDLDSFDEPYLRKLESFLKGQGRELWALDLTSDLGIPVFTALSGRTGDRQEQIVIGFGAHLDARIAILRAVTELSQSLTWVLPAHKDTNAIPETLEDLDLLNWLKAATFANHPYLVPDESAPERIASAYPKRWTDDVKDDVILCRELVERHGMEMLVLDQTRPDIGLPVVKVIVPGLRHYWPRFAPGRLYQVPVTLGWLNEPLHEEQLNPIPMFL
jgi:oxazoline/thiazoline synthase